MPIQTTISTINNNVFIKIQSKLESISDALQLDSLLSKTIASDMYNFIDISEVGILGSSCLGIICKYCLNQNNISLIIGNNSYIKEVLSLINLENKVDIFEVFDVEKIKNKGQKYDL